MKTGNQSYQKKTIKKFLCTNWSNNEEKKNLSKYKIYSPQQNNIIKDVYTLRNKRKKFFSKINMISNKNIDYNNIKIKRSKFTEK